MIETLAAIENTVRIAGKCLVIRLERFLLPIREQQSPREMIINLRCLGSYAKRRSIRFNRLRQPPLAVVAARQPIMSFSKVCIQFDGAAKARLSVTVIALLNGDSAACKSIGRDIRPKASCTFRRPHCFVHATLLAQSDREHVPRISDVSVRREYFPIDPLSLSHRAGLVHLNRSF